MHLVPSLLKGLHQLDYACVVQNALQSGWEAGQASYSGDALTLHGVQQP